MKTKPPRIIFYDINIDTNVCYLKIDVLYEMG